jgi:two-component system, LuxR family, response regulator FixJ
MPAQKVERKPRKAGIIVGINSRILWNGYTTMNDNAIARIFVVDDDDCIRVAVCAILKRAKYDCSCFPDVASCLGELKVQSNLREEGCDLLITDVKMPGKDGLELLQEARAAFPWIPVIVMTAYGSIPMSVQAVKTGAFDFIEKPVEEEKLLNIVELALLKEADLHDPLVGKPLTRPERIVLCLILEGISNKRIAYILERSERTIEVHRSRIMRKLGVDNLVDLVKKATAMGWTE